MQAKERLDSLLRQTLVPLARAAGFRKTRLSFHRRRGTADQTINIQLSQWNTWDKARFYVNLGLCFDELSMHRKQPVNETPKEYERQRRQRMEEVLAGLPQQWTITAKTDLEQMGEKPRAAFGQLLENFAEIDGLDRFRRHPWFQAPSDPEFVCEAHYVAGDFDAARREVQRVAAEFRDRQGMSKQNLIERLNLDRLKARSKG